MNAFRHFQNEHYKKFPKKDPAAYQEKLKKFQEQKAAQEKAAEQAKQTTQDSKPTTQPVSTEKTTKQPVEEKKEATESTQKAEPTQQESTAQPKKDSSMKAISTYNGGSNERYNWSQNINDVTVQIPIPPGTRAKQLSVEMTVTKLKAKLKAGDQVLIEGEFYDRIKPEDSTWSIDEDSLILVLEKGNENIWKTVLKGDAEIDATKVENSKPIQDFDPETQTALRKIMYEQQRKQMGLPTTEEEQQMEMLKKAWDAEGSPFKGQPFDPSKFNLPGSNSMNLNLDK